jgi:uncharacterized protein
VISNKDIIVLGNKELETLIALTEEEQEIGLMNRSWPPPIMTFPFKKAHVSKFWMLNTPTPLDIIFCKGRRIIDIFSGVPYSLSLVGPDEPSDFVVELPKGTAKKLGIKSGDFADIKYSVRTLAKKYASILE